VLKNFVKQEDLLDLITALLKLNCFVNATVTMQAVLDDSLITVNTSLDQHKLCYCTINLSLCEIYDDITVLIWKLARDMPMNDTKGNKCHAINTAFNKQLSS